MTNRGIRFGVSYFGVRDRRHAERDLEEIARAGFHAVTHTLSEHDLRYHEGDLEFLVRATRDRGLEVGLDPWGVGGLFGGEAYSELALVDLSSRQVDSQGTSVPACCPNAPATRVLLKNWTSRASALKPDVLFWDEPHFYLGALREDKHPCCRCQHCSTRWQTETGSSLPPEGDPELVAFRERCLVELLTESAQTASPSVKHSLCLLPRGEYEGAASDTWDSWAALPWLSRLGTDPYWMDRDVDRAEFVRTHTRPLLRAAKSHGLQSEIWLQGIRIERGHEDAIATAVGVAAEEGAERVAFWSFRGTERMSWLSCEDPQRAWEVMCECVASFG